MRKEFEQVEQESDGGPLRIASYMFSKDGALISTSYRSLTPGEDQFYNQHDSRRYLVNELWRKASKQIQPEHHATPPPTEFAGW